jgi:hypothetical protein
VKSESLQRPEVAAFVQYYLDNIQTITETALFIPPTQEEIDTASANLQAALGS